MAGYVHVCINNDLKVVDLFREVIGLPLSFYVPFVGVVVFDDVKKRFVVPINKTIRGKYKPNCI